MRRTIMKGLVVSCQAMPHEPLYGSELMAAMAKAAEHGGAVGIRANSAQDIAAIRKVTELPIIGINKREIADSSIYITPTLKDAIDVIDAGADIVAIDATTGVRPDGKTLANTIKAIKDRGAQIMCDISTLEEGIRASQAGADFISTTLSGFTPYSTQQEEPDFKLVSELVGKISVPIVAEGRIWEPRQVVMALELGAAFVVVGTAITRPQVITQRFVDEIREWKRNNAGR
ncbi:N-acetylmannosamine-6-phosphate 2-epimerase [Paenibacillus sp. sptzw28]|uniref:N-acetylmannosamine-6-phosphate 2-epimerase n=1 Tax=Paenibacillus sp. sptzw28 TaxID=715179 RepID=UPI001C6EBA50|nr:N-acetylmannosamine-6-phosphate 2-epimerase [Paenibacillus sp. sptzw28]QYR19196.1 N-acetylmannosamine-6-phosphate 2-epimerase [Paenibacillus sp. sptzw28]